MRYKGKESGGKKEQRKMGGEREEKMIQERENERERERERARERGREQGKELYRMRKRKEEGAI